MRISDWSSDVCSSDLSAICSARPRSQARDMLILNARACSSRLMSREMLVALRLEEMADLLMRPSLFMRNIYAHDRQRKDRKSVVSGGVSVRVDHGGRCIYKKKIK